MTKFIAAIFLGVFLSAASMTAGQEAGSPARALADPELTPAKEAFFAGKPDVAYILFLRAHENDHRFSPPGVYLAILSSRDGDYPNIHKSLGRAVEDEPLDPEAWLQLGDLAVQEGRLVEAALLLNCGQERLKRFSESDASTSGEKVRRIYLENEAIVLESRLAEARGEWDRAISAAERLLERNPENDSPRLRLGYLLWAKGDVEGAEKALDEAARLNPNNLPGWLAAAIFFDRDGRTEEAKQKVRDRFDPETLCSETGKQDGASRKILDVLIGLNLKWNRLDEAKKLLEKLAADSASRWSWSGDIHLYEGDFAAAEIDYRRAVQFDPNSVAAQNGYARALAGQNNEAKCRQARQIASELRKKYPDRDETTATLGWTELLLGRIERANDLLRPLLDSGSFGSTTAYYLAELMVAEGEREMARTLLDLALEKEDNFPYRNDARRLLDALNKADEISEEKPAAENVAN